MGILPNAKPVGIICVRERERAKAFSRDVWGLTQAQKDPFAAIFEVGGTSIGVEA